MTAPLLILLLLLMLLMLLLLLLMLMLLMLLMLLPLLLMPLPMLRVRGAQSSPMQKCLRCCGRWSTPRYHPQPPQLSRATAVAPPCRCPQRLRATSGPRAPPAELAP
jgi:hypothetical protein